jgi:hypothetical protein
MSISIPVTKKKCLRGSVVTISATKALTALHGRVKVGTDVSIRNRHGIELKGTVTYSIFEEDKHDIAVITLIKPHMFIHFVPMSSTPVTLGDALLIISYTADIRDNYGLSLDHSYVKRIVDGTSLFHSRYYSTDGMSGCGVIVSYDKSTPQVVGVHVGSHDSTIAVEPAKKSKKRTFDKFMDQYNLDVVRINSNIHDHGAYTLICETIRVPEVVEFCT